MSPCWRHPCPSLNNLHTAAVLDMAATMHHLPRTTKDTRLYHLPHTKIRAAMLMVEDLSNMGLLPKYHP